jgi:hypothetical protein
MNKVIQEIALIEAMDNYQFKNINTAVCSRSDIVIAIIDDWPLVGIVGRVVSTEFVDGHLVYKLRILQSIGPVSTHQANDSEHIYVNPFEIYERLD